MPSELLADVRTRLDYTQKEFAEALGVPFRTYQRYEGGETKKVPADVVMKAQALPSKKKAKKARR